MFVFPFPTKNLFEEPHPTRRDALIVTNQNWIYLQEQLSGPTLSFYGFHYSNSIKTITKSVYLVPRNEHFNYKLQWFFF